MGIVGLTYSSRELAGQVRRHGNAISPGAATRMTDSVPVDRRRSRSACDDERSPDNVAPIVAYLASERSGWITGRVIHSIGLRDLAVQQPRADQRIIGTGPWDDDEAGRPGGAVLRPAARPEGLSPRASQGAAERKGRAGPDPGHPALLGRGGGGRAAHPALPRLRRGRTSTRARSARPAARTSVEWFTASGDATLYSYVINHRPAPGFEEETPYAIAVVQLAEGPRMMTSLGGVPATPEDLVLDMPLRVAFQQRGEVAVPSSAPRRGAKHERSGPGVIIAGAAETDKIGRLPNHSTLQLHIEAARNAVADAGLTMKDIDGIATVSAPGPVQVAHALGIYPDWVDGTGVGGTSFLLHVRHAAAAIRAGYAQDVLITHGESGRSRIGAAGVPAGPSSLAGQFEAPYGTARPDHHLHHPGAALHEGVRAHPRAARLRRGGAAQVGGEEPAGDVPRPDHGRGRAQLPDGRLPVPPAGVLPGHRRRRRAGRYRGGPGGGLPQAAGHVLGTGEASETPMISQMIDFTESRAFRQAGQRAFAEAGITTADVDHLMIYDAFAHVPIYGLEALGFVKKGEAGRSSPTATPSRAARCR